MVLLLFRGGGLLDSDTHRNKMHFFLSFMIVGMKLRLITGLFTVTVPKELYMADYGSNVTMECNFDTGGQVDIEKLRVSWTKDKKKIVNFPNKQEDPEIHSEHSGRRMTLIEDQLYLRKALLHIKDVQIMDAGQYHCLIFYGDAGDYKYVTLQVTASYQIINTQVIKVPGSNEMELTCWSKGYPLAVVSWANISVPVNTNHSLTPEGLYNITSILRLKTNTHRNFSCEFWNQATQEMTTAILDTNVLDQKDKPSIKSSQTYVFIFICIIISIFIAALIFLVRWLCPKVFHRKGLSL
ncbi:programmed cell death 1 ligand 2 [Monodelphis domestica]|uniref:Programmed cell death 1 ligand 2 n=1 Tax=Monodelphis domestica TaxID=13616 RepID=F6WY92_MONDO|nr:programmed cell death 1 ligand 2 [Monodelphis domestica]